MGDARLSDPARGAIEDAANVCLVSPASYREIAIKIGLGRYNLAVLYEAFIQEANFDNGFEVLPISPAHTEALIGLPRYHGDPFDRLLLAQATVEAMTLVSGDQAFDAYAVPRIW
ncbi:MAG: type II toxin-antitoxin system VapC family toxin [Isosphaeraceae bacterium]